MYTAIKPIEGIVPALSDREIEEMNQKEHEYPGYFDEEYDGNQAKDEYEYPISERNEPEDQR